MLTPGSKERSVHFAPSLLRRLSRISLQRSMAVVGFVALTIFTLQMIPDLRRALREIQLNHATREHLARHITVRISPPSTVEDALEALQYQTADEAFASGVPIYVSPEEFPDCRAWLNKQVDIRLYESPARELLLQIVSVRKELTFRMDNGMIVIGTPAGLLKEPKLDPRAWNYPHSL
jgi:hypothetical protein